MTRLFCALLTAAALIACAPVESAPGPVGRTDHVEAPTPPPEDTCGLEAHKGLIGRLETEIAPAELPPGHRFICPTCMVTQDYAPARLNLHTSTEGRVASLRCG